MLNRAAFAIGGLVEVGGLDADEVTRVLVAAAQTAGPSEAGATATARSGLSAGLPKPPPCPRVVLAGWAVSGDDDGVVDLGPYLDGSACLPAPPALLRRTDDLGMLYAGRVNLLMGEPESGKSWLAFAAVAEAVRDVGTAVFMDLEDSPAGAVDRLRSLGLSDDQIRTGVTYACPESPSEVAALIDRVGAEDHALVVVDSTTELLALLGFDSNDNTHVTEALRDHVRPFTAKGAAVLLLDHVTKAVATRRAYPIGAQARKAAIDGAAYEIKVVTPLGRGCRGSLRITLTKDRPGHVRGRLATVPTSAWPR